MHKQASRKGPQVISVLKKKLGYIEVNANCHRQQGVSLGPMHRSKVFIISEMTTKRCDSERDMVGRWCGYEASPGLKMNCRKASGDWVTKHENSRGNYIYVNKCKMIHENTILTLHTNLIMAPNWLLLLGSEILKI